MNNNVFSMREDSMQNTVRGLDKCFVDGDATGSGIPANFAGMSNAGMFDMGISTINQQVNSITNSIFNVKNIVNKHSNEMFDMDRGMARAARNIEIPQDFVTNETNQVNTFNSYLLEKMDGKSVNVGSELGTIAPVADSGIQKMETLKDIINDNVVEQEKIDENTGIIKENLGKIDNEQDTMEQKVREATGIVGQVLSDISKKSATEEKELDSTNSVLKADLFDFNSNDSDMTNQYLNLDTSNVPFHERVMSAVDSIRDDMKK